MCQIRVSAKATTKHAAKYNRQRLLRARVFYTLGTFWRNIKYLYTYCTIIYYYTYYTLYTHYTFLVIIPWYFYAQNNEISQLMQKKDTQLLFEKDI